MNNEGNKTVLAIVAHPDDAEFNCAGTLALLKEKGWKVEIASMTAGDCGSMEYDRQEISTIRRKRRPTRQTSSTQITIVLIVMIFSSCTTGKLC